jgi:hypothetical protein
MRSGAADEADSNRIKEEGLGLGNRFYREMTERGVGNVAGERTNRIKPGARLSVSRRPQNSSPADRDVAIQAILNAAR